MKIIISTGGKFHAFHLARQLNNRGMLKKIITGYPKFKLKGEGIELNKIKSFSIPFLIEYFLSKIEFLKKRIPINYLYKLTFDFFASQYINDCDLFIGWSGNCLKSIKKAKKNNAVVVVDRGAAHISYQDRILREEYLKYGIKIDPIDKRIIKRELLEYDLADYIMVPSSFVKTTFVNEGIPKEKILVCPYGVDINRFNAVPKEDNVFRIIYAGSISFQKGVQYLLEAVNELNYDNFELVLIGNIESSKMERMVNNTKKCKFIGRIPQNELFWYYSQGSVFVQPSIQDGFAMTIVEATSCGLPVIATNHVGGTDIIVNGKNGFIIPIRDPEAIKEKLILLRNDETKLRAMSESAKNTAKLYTWDRYGNEISSIYFNIMNKIDRKDRNDDQ